jgi:ribose 5-phosphate isomerase B
MKIVIGADHRGYNLKENLKKKLSSKYEIVDVGTNSTESVDYPDITVLAVKKIQSGECERGIIMCGSGVGASVAANKFKEYVPLCAMIHFQRTRAWKTMI